MKNKAEIRDEIQKLIDRGVRITIDVDLGNIEYADNAASKMLDAFDEFQLWKHAVRMFFLKYGDQKSASYFFEADDVPFLKGGIEYSDIHTEKSHTLLKNIKATTLERLKYLRSVNVDNLKLVTQKEQRTTVEKIFVVQPEQGERKITIIINGDYARPLKVSTRKRTWEDLVKIASEGSARYFKPTVTYLNSNTKNVIYSNTGLGKTKILTSDRDKMYPAVSVETISKSVFNRRLNKLKSE